jgi:dihydropyrimidine dehydrogenase (NAD+) subunit PreA
MSNLEVTVCGVKFKNPVVVASAPTTKNEENIRRAFESGAGGVVMKSVSDDPNFRISFRPMFTILHKTSYPSCFSNYSTGLASNDSPDRWMKELENGRKWADRFQGVLIGSILSAKSVEAWAALAQRIEGAGAHMIELDVSCPSVFGTGAGADEGRKPELAAMIVEAVLKRVSIPVFSKLTSDAVDPVVIAQRIKQVGGHGITIMNRTPSLDIDIETGRPLLTGGFCGLGGPWVRPLMLRWVARVSKEVGLPVSATNGIWVWEDVVKAIMCGAYTVQTCTAIMYGKKGFGVVEDFVKGLNRYLDERGFSNVEEIRGKTLPQIRSFDSIERRDKGEVWVEVDRDVCIHCKLCKNWCFHQAISPEYEEDGTPHLMKENCEGCGLCVILCPSKAIRLEGKGPFILGDYK